MEAYAVVPIESSDIKIYLDSNIIVPESLKSIPKSSSWYRTKYSVEDIFDNFDRFNSNDNTVGVQTGNKYLPDVRVSRSIGPVMISDIEDNSVIKFNHIKSVYPNRYRNTSESIEINCQLHNLDFQLHRYAPGGFFAKHTDAQKTTLHFATLLLFPPANLSPFTGGDLLLYPESSDVIRIVPSQLTHWTLVVFTLSMEHECTMVTSGYRFVFKAELELSRDNMFFANKTPSTMIVPVTTAENIIKHQSKVHKYQDKIRKHEEKIVRLNDRTADPKVLNLIQLIENTEGDVCVVLTTDVASVDPNMLKGQEAILWNTVVQKWPYSSLRVIDTSYCAGDGLEEVDTVLEFEKEHTEIGEAKILYWKLPFKYCGDVKVPRIFGKVKKTQSKYNDNTYDKYYDLTVTLICVQKHKYTD